MRSIKPILAALLTLTLLAAPAAAEEGSWYCWAEVLATSTPDCLQVEPVYESYEPNQLAVSLTNNCEDFAVVDCLEENTEDIVLCGTPIKLQPGQNAEYAFEHNGGEVSERTLRAVVGDERGEIKLSAYDDDYWGECGGVMMCAMGGSAPSSPSIPLAISMLLFGAAVVVQRKK
jgi:hypothetical protein